MLQAASIVCPEKKGQISNISLLTNTVAERCQVTYDKLCEKAKRFCACSVALNESTDITDNAQLAIYACGVDKSFEVTEQFLTVIPVHGQTTSREIFGQLCDAIMDAGLPRKRFAVDDAPNVLQMELIVLQCNSELKANFREVSGKADKLGQFLREKSSLSFSGCSSGTCAFLGVQICVKSCSLP